MTSARWAFFLSHLLEESVSDSKFRFRLKISYGRFRSYSPIRAYNNIGMYDFADIIISLTETTHE